jgi:ribonucleoside-diphosphate reductase beta chain
VIADYPHFLVLARRAHWDEADVDLQPDAAAWPGLDPGVRLRLERLVAGFCVGEAGVAEHLGPFGAAAQDPDAARCFAAQERDERRHSAFFDRVARDVLAAPGATPEERRSALRPLLAPEFLDLFEVRLPGMADALARGDGNLERAVGLYHMVLEGVVFTAGQYALLERLEDGRLPGLQQGMELVLRDERWHVGFGARCLADLDYDEAAILAEGEAAAALWAPEYAERVTNGLRSRLRAVRRQAAVA